MAYLKANPDTVSYASSGTGQSPHLTAAWFLQLTGLKMTHVPFRGAGPALHRRAPRRTGANRSDNCSSLRLLDTRDGKLTVFAL